MAGADETAASGGMSDQAFAEAHRTLLRARDIQFDFAATPAPEPPRWLGPLLEALQAFGPVLKYVFWGGLIAGAALLLYFLLREFVPNRWFRRDAGPAEGDWRPEPGRARALLEDADRLATEGRFEEAIHLLLFRSIDDLVARRPGVVRPALTSRDIAGLQALPGDARAAFARLAAGVEHSFFGGRPADAGAFRAARSDYETFAFAEGWR